MSEPFVFSDTRRCGCRVDVSWNEPDDGPPYALSVVPYACPLHNAAPKLFAVLEESARVRHECEVRIDSEWGAPLAERHEGHEFEDCPQAECSAAREAIKEACPPPST